jgi:hypothetical protein
MYVPSHGDLNNLVLDLMTYQAFVAGITHIPEMMEGEGLAFQESLLRVLAEMCDSEFAFAAIHPPSDGVMRPFASYPSPPPVTIPERLDSPFLLAAVEHERYDMIKDGKEDAKQFLPGLSSALVVPYRHRGARCVVCVCNRDPESLARPGLGVPYISHEVKMIQALMELRPI